MQYGRSGLLALFFFFTWTLLRAQGRPPVVSPSPSYVFRHLDGNDGLLVSNVYGITQDHRGYMWIGTSKGLQRYDGLRFLYCPDKAAGPGVAALYPDAAHQRIVYNIPGNVRERSFLSNQSNSIVPGRDLVAAKAQRYQGINGTFEVQEHLLTKTNADSTIQQGLAFVRSPDSSQPMYTTYLRDKRRQQLWVVNGTSSLELFNEKTKQQYSRATNYDGNLLLQMVNRNPAMIRDVMIDNHENVWMIAWSELIYRYNIPTNQLFRYSIYELRERAHNPINTPCWSSYIMEDSHGKIWITTAGAGLISYDPEQDDFNLFFNDHTNPLSLRYNYELSCVYQDREENIWVGGDRGISIFNPYQPSYHSLGNPSIVRNPRPGSEISTMYQLPGGEWLVGTWGSGLFICDEQMTLRRSLFFKENIDYNRIWSVLPDNKGRIWVGCQHGMVHILNAAGVVERSEEVPIFEHSTIRSMAKDASGNLLFGLHNGKVIMRDEQSGEYLPYAAGMQTAPFPLSSVLTLQMINAECYAGTQNGLARFDPQRRCFTGLYQPEQGSSAACFSILSYNDSLLLTGFENIGLYFFNKRTHRFSKIEVDYGRPLWSAIALYKDDTGNIWFTTEYDICRYTPSHQQFSVWHPEKGLLSSSFYAPGKLLRTPSGEWLTWTLTEVVRFSEPDKPIIPYEQLKPTITGLRVFDEPVFLDSLLAVNRPLRLQHQQNFLTIEFSDLLFSGTNQVSFYYRLHGVDKDWVPALDKRYAGYTNLPPGTYRFEVKVGPPGQVSPVTSMVIEILAPFWQTTWFKTLCILIVGGLLYGLAYWHFRNVRTEAAMKEQIAQTEMMALRAQMNPHFIFNCLNGIDALILSDDKYQATIYLNKFAMLIRNILDSSRQQAVPLRKDLETLRLYIELEQWRHEHKFKAVIHTDASVLQGEYKVPPLVIQPYVENAILHGLRNRTDKEGQLTIHIYREQDQLVYIIEDNGVGRTTVRDDKQHRSHGMDISLGRLKLFNQQETVPVQVTDLGHDGKASGTRVEVHLNIR